ALNGLVFTPTTDYYGPVSLQMNTLDWDSQESVDGHVSIAVNDIDDTPNLTLPGNQGINENTALVFSNANHNVISLSDPDAANDSSFQVTLSASHGVLTVATIQGLTFTSGSGTSDGQMTFTGALSNINAALDGLVYMPALD